MKKYLPSFPFKSILIILGIIFYGNCFAQTQEVKITLTGYSDDVIADAVLNTLPSAVSTNSIDLPTGTGNLFSPRDIVIMPQPILTDYLTMGNLPVAPVIIFKWLLLMEIILYV